MHQTFHAIKEAVATEAHLSDDGSPLREIFTGGRSQNFRRAFLGVVVQCFQQITGINLITYYAVSVLSSTSHAPRSTFFGSPAFAKPQNHVSNLTNH